jgi:hypothetical protein
MTVAIRLPVLAIASLLLLGPFAIPAHATSITIVGDATGTDSTATGTVIFNSATNTLTFTIFNTSPYDARITGLGFDLAPTGNASASGLNGFTGSVTYEPTGVDFLFSDGDVGTVPQFNAAVLDFAFITGNSGNFSGGSPNDGLPPGIAPGDEASFLVSGAAFTGFTETQIAGSLYARFQRVGLDGEGSDVGIGVPGNPPPPPPPAVVPEPSTLSLVGIGLAAAWRKRRTIKSMMK